MHKDGIEYGYHSGLKMEKWNNKYACMSGFNLHDYFKSIVCYIWTTKVAFEANHSTSSKMHFFIIWNTVIWLYSAVVDSMGTTEETCSKYFCT